MSSRCGSRAGFRSDRLTSSRSNAYRTTSSLLFLAAQESIVGGEGEEISSKAAQVMADLYFSLVDRDAADEDQLRRFILADPLGAIC